jgi:t-SNARE complex subunit (syntaxin)
MSKVQAIEAELQQLTAHEIREVRDWLDNFMEDQLQFTDEFEADIQQSERDMAAGVSARTRQPGAGK